jgi:hypothetical protein
MTIYHVYALVAVFVVLFGGIKLTRYNGPSVINGHRVGAGVHLNKLTHDV